jgi:protein O-mannosyl-transferase
MPRPVSLGSPSGDAPFSNRRGLVAVGLIALVVLAAYFNSFSGPLVFDDESSIAANPTILRLWPAGEMFRPPISAGVAGRPVLNVSFAVNHAVSGVDVWSYHALNVVVHMLGGLTLFGVVRRTLLRLDGDIGARAAPLALAASMIWLVQPVQTASVTYISQRAESLMALWYLLTLYCFIRSVEPVESGAPTPGVLSDWVGIFSRWRRRGWMGLSVLSCGLGMATKEVMVTAPLVVVLYDRVFVAGNWAAVWRQRWRLHLALGCTWLLLAWLMADLSARGREYGVGVSWWSYAWTECRVVLLYVKLAVWPHPLVFDSGLKAGGNSTAFHAMMLVILVALTLVIFWRRPRIGFAGLWFFVILAPTSSVVPIMDQPMAENRVYLPLAGVLVLAVCGLHALLGRRVWLVLGLLTAGCLLLTAQRNQDFRSEIGLWRDTIAKCPGNARAHNNLGASLAGLPDRVPEEIAEYETALRLDPGYAEAHVNLGKTLAVFPERLEEAIRHYAAALRLEPDNAGAHLALANALVRSGHLAEAIAAYATALRLAPDSADIHFNFANALARSNRPDEAMTHYDATLRLAPGHMAAHLNAGNLRAAKGQFDMATLHFETAVRLAPDSAEARYCLADALAQSGRVPAALSQYGAALRLAPGNAELRTGFGQALLSAGRAEEAIAQFEEALRLRPDHAAARAGLAEARTRLRQPAR